MKEGFPKLNYEYAAQLLTNINLRNEFFDWIGSNIKERLSINHSIINEIVNFCSQRVYSLTIDNKENCIEMSNHLHQLLLKPGIIKFQWMHVCKRSDLLPI